MATRWEMPLRLNSSVTSSGMEARSPRRMPRARADSGAGSERAAAALRGEAGRSLQDARELQPIAVAIAREEARRDQNLAARRPPGVAVAVGVDAQREALGEAALLRLVHGRAAPRP